MASSTMGTFLHQARVGRYFHAEGVCVHVRTYGDAVEVAAGRDGRPSTTVLLVRFAGPVPEFQCIDGHDGRGWHMVAGVPPYPCARHDPFARLLELLARYGGPAEGNERRRGGLRRQRLRARLAHPLRAAAADTAARCDPEVLAAVRRFPPSVRFGIYRGIVAASSPHARRALLQLTRTCPAILAGAAALATCRKRRRPLADRVVARAGESPPITRLADEMVELVWSDPYPPAHRRWYLPDPWEHARTLQGPERARAMLAHRQLLRRAGPRVPPAYLITPPPLAFSLDDIPPGVWDNAAWYRVMMGAACTRVPPAADRSAARLPGRLAFLSRHGAALARTFFQRTRPVFGSVPNLVESIFVFADLADLRIDRATPLDLVENLLERYTATHVLDLKLLDRETIAREDRFDLDDAPVLRGDRVWVEPVRGAAALLLLGKRMRNCAASLAVDCRRGHVAVCTARVEGRRYTAAFRRAARKGWELVELKAPANLPVRPPDLAAMVRAVEDAGLGVLPRLRRRVRGCAAARDIPVSPCFRRPATTPQADGPQPSRETASTGRILAGSGKSPPQNPAFGRP